MKRELYKRQINLQGSIRAPSNTSAGMQVLKASVGFADTITSIGESLVNLNQIINTQQGVGEAVQSSHYLTAQKSQDITLAHEAYNTSILDQENMRESALNLANTIDPTGNLSNRISDLSVDNQIAWASKSVTEINKNNAQRASDPGLYAMKIANVAGPDSSDRRDAMIKAQTGVKNPVLFSKTEITSMQDTIKGTDTDKAFQMLEGILNGENVDLVTRQLFAKDSDGQGLPTLYKFVTNVEPIHRTAFLKGMQYSKDDYKEYNESQGTLVDTFSDIKGAISGDGEINTFIQSITGNHGRKDIELRPGIIDGFQRITMYQISRGKTLSEAKEAAFDIVTSGFDQVNEATVRAVFPKTEDIDVPTTVKQLSNIIEDPVMLNRAFEIYNVRTPGSNVIGDAIGGGPRIFREFVQENGYMVNANDTTEGYMIMVDYPLRLVSEPLTNEDGEIIIIKHNELKNFNKPPVPRRGYRPGKNAEFYDNYNKASELEENLKAEKKLYKPRTNVNPRSK